MYKISAKGLQLIKEFEGCELTAYQDVVGIWTIGVGHVDDTIHEGMTITQEQADELLRKDLNRFETAINGLVTVPITQGIYDALCSFTFNVGEGALADSTLLRLLNKRNYSDSLNQLLRWDKAGGESIPGLTRRRKAEQQLGYSQPFPV
jgi:lysozyme